MSDNTPTATADQIDRFLPPPPETKPRSQRDEVVLKARFFVKGIDSLDLVHGTNGDFWAVYCTLTTHNIYNLLMELMAKLPLDKAAKDRIWGLYHHLCRCIDAPPEF